MLTDIGRGDAMVALDGEKVAGSAELNERDVRRWLHGLQLWHAARFVVIVEFLVTIVVSAATVTRCSAEHPSICGPSTQGDWALALAILTGLLLLTAPGLGCVSGIALGVLGAARDPTIGARGWWAAGAALSVGLLVSLSLIRHRQRQVAAARMQPLTPSADGIARTRIRLRDWAVVPGVLAAAGIVAMVLYSHDAANSHRHEQNAQRATAVVYELDDGFIDGFITVEITPADQLIFAEVGVQHAGTYAIGEQVPVLVDLTDDEPWVRLVAEPDDPSTWRLVALGCFMLAGAFLVLRARRWQVRRDMATRDLQAISVSVRRLEDDVVAVFAAEGSGRPVALLRIIAGNEIADREAGGSFFPAGRHGDLAYLSGQFWYGGVVRMRSRDRRHVADAMVRLPRWTLVESWVRPTRDVRAEMARRPPSPDALLSDSPTSPPQSSAPPQPDLAAGRTTWQPPPDDLSSDSPASAHGTELAVAPAAATAPQPFRIYNRHRRTAAWIGWPLCAALLAFPATAGLIAVLGARNTAWLSELAAPAFGLLGVVWIPAIVFYVRPHVRVEQAGVTLVNSFSRYQIPWNAIDRVELRPVHGPENTVLAFTTPHGVINAEAPHGYGETDPRMIQCLELIAEYRDQMRLTDPKSSATIKVSGAAALLPRWRRLR